LAKWRRTRRAACSSFSAASWPRRNAQLTGPPRGNKVHQRAGAFMRSAANPASGPEPKNTSPRIGPRRIAPPAIALQAALIPELVPGFTDAPARDLVPANTPPRMWFGTQVTVQTHYDPSEHIAIVVAGRRRFTLFPPDQLNNLYIGPLEMTPAGVPVSLASIDAPDFNAHPRMAEALKCGQSAELEPGDGLFIHYHWLHHVASLERYNLLVNYWWSPSDPAYGAPRDALVHALIAVRTLPAHQRAAWRIMFEHYVFEADGDPAAHIPAHARGVLGAIEPVQARRVLKLLGGKLASS
jgi:hypothetical protein